MPRDFLSRIIFYSAFLILATMFYPVYAQDEAATTEKAAGVESTAEVTVEAALTEESIATPAPTTEPERLSGQTTYKVQRGDNLFRIALRHNVSTRALAEANGIVNPSLIFVGQELIIPSTQSSTAATIVSEESSDGSLAALAPTTTPAPSATYVVVPGDTLFRIAVRFSTTVSDLVAANDLGNRNLIFVGQRLVIPGSDVRSDSVPATTTETVTTEDSAGFGFDYGIEIFLVGQDSQTLSDQAISLGMNWVKLDINWRDLEASPGQIDFATLDNIVNVLETRNLNILFTVTTSPPWARTSVDEDGPPDNFTDYADFVRALAERYDGRVQAFEIWSEPNLRREWNSTVHAISAAGYTDMLQLASEAIKSVSPSMAIISAGLSPTGFNDGVNAINDRAFLNAMYSNGFSDFVDAVGVHPNGWANPPDAMCCEASIGIATHFEDASFYFLDTLNDYREIMLQNDDANTPIWVTRFGWGSSEDTDPPSANNVFLTYTTLGEQAIYDPRAFDLGAELGFVGPMFLYNLNACQAQLDSLEGCYYSLIGPRGGERPAFGAVGELDKGTNITDPG